MENDLSVKRTEEKVDLQIAPKKPEYLNYELENRMPELKQFVQNLKYNWENSHKKITVACQTRGSGKKFFGEYILWAANQHKEELMSIVTEAYRPQFEEFLTAKHISVACRGFFYHPGNDQFWPQMFGRITLLCPEFSAKCKEANLNEDTVTFKNIAQVFKELCKRPLFLSFYVTDFIMVSNSWSNELN